jgi:hypothetical protein
MSEPTADYLAAIRRWGFTGPGEVDIDRIITDSGDDFEPMRAAHGRRGCRGDLLAARPSVRRRAKVTGR